MSHKVYIGNFPYETTEDDLESALSAYGKVTYVKVIRDRDSGRSKGFGFAEFDTAEAMNQAIENLDGKDFNGRTIKVNEAREKPKRF